MASYLFSWSPSRSDIREQDLNEKSNRLRNGLSVEYIWGCDFLYNNINIGDTFYLYRSGNDNGIIGYGFIAEKLGKRPHWD